MKLVVGNVETKVVVGGKDNLLPFNILDELRKYLRVKVDGYHYAMKGGRRWDGWRYFITPTGKFATGFLPKVINYLEELGVEDIEIEDERGDLPKLNEEIDGYIGNINGEEWEARDYQTEIVSKINNYITYGGGKKLYFPRGILDCATNAGKNSMSALILNNLPKDESIIFMVSSTIIFKQALEFFQAVLGREEIGQVGGGKVEFRRFNVCMVKTLLNRAKESANVRKILKETRVLIVDESDEAGAKEYSKVLTYIGAGMRIFVSGTPLEAKKVNNMIAVGLSGLVLGRISNKELIQAGHSQNPIVNVLFCDAKNGGFISYEEEKRNNLHLNRERAMMVAKLIQKHSDKNIVISYIETAHGYFMHEVAKELNPDVDMAIIHGGSEDRDSALEDFKKGRISVLFTSMILKRGANIPNIEVFIMAQGGKSTITVKQLIGRAVRHDGKSSDVLVYDFYDYNSKHLSKHSRDRLRIYEKEGFDIERHYNSVRGVAQDDATTKKIMEKFWE